MTNPLQRPLWGAAAIVLAAVLGRILQWLGARLEAQTLDEERRSHGS